MIPASAGPIAVLHTGVNPALPCLPVALTGLCLTEDSSRKAPCLDLQRGEWLRAAQDGFAGKGSWLGTAACRGSTGQTTPSEQRGLGSEVPWISFFLKYFCNYLKEKLEARVKCQD